MKKIDTRIINQLVTICLFLFVGVASHAQNSIDEMVENISTLGSSKYTSVVDRDPKTRQINKVVKVLQVPGLQADKLRKAFLKEKDEGSFSHSKNDKEETMTLTVESPKRVRIYMLRMEMSGQYNYSSAKVTVIVKNNTRGDR